MTSCNVIIRSLIRFLQTSKSFSDTPLHILPASFMASIASRDAVNGLKFIAFCAKSVVLIPVVVMINQSPILQCFFTNQILLIFYHYLDEYKAWCFALMVLWATTYIF